MTTSQSRSLRIAVVTSNYPWNARPSSGTFVQSFVSELARQGHQCTVVAPTTMWDVLRFGTLGPRRELVSGERGARNVDIRRPRIITASAIGRGLLSTSHVSQLVYEGAALREIWSVRRRLDAIYAHFFYPSGIAAAHCSRICGIPYFVAHGDDDVDDRHLRGGGRDFRDVAGVVAVSRRNADFCTKSYGIDGKKVGLFPNGVDTKLFFPRNKAEARERLKLPREDFIVVFVGRFIERKGPGRVVEAIEGLPRMAALLIGEGRLEVTSRQIVFKGVVEHERLPWYLSAADLFVLPTTGEGSCNAILEAMACGVPVVSSKGAFNDDILNDRVSMRVDPMNIDEIRRTIKLLVSRRGVLEKMSAECLKWTQRFSIDRRTRDIVDFVRRRIADQEGW